MKNSKSFSSIMIQLGRKYGLREVFNDFLEMVVCALSLGDKEDLYLKIIRKYEKPEAYAISEAFGVLVMEMDNRGEGLKDCFGDFFMEYLSFGKNGQFFTPEPICELMARMINPAGFGDRVADCCCGSGRMLLAAARINRNALFYAADVDRTCALMCLVNFCLNGMLGEVAWMNTLTNELYAAWAIALHPEHNIPYIREITKDESYLLLRLPEHKEEKPPKGVQSQLIFEF